MKICIRLKIADILWYYNRLSVTQRYQETKGLMQLQKIL